MPIAIRSRSLLLAAVLVFATMGGAWAQDGEIPVELAPEAVAIAPCSLLAGGIEVDAQDLRRAAAMALAAGYRIGFIMGYANGVLDETGTPQPLSEGEFRDFGNAYAEVCGAHPEATILEAARAAAARLMRR
ncbi:MAG: hypothetical protein HOH66_16785 [Rhodospirillaceae bacterium]|jgi:hypothetical protein|nr:hypothetical protein [Rhodospirillaceae bacterium]